MMFTEGQIFNIDGRECCLLGIINYDSNQYGLFSTDVEKIAYFFYQIVDTGEGYNFIYVEDEYLNCILLDMYEEGVLNEE